MKGCAKDVIERQKVLLFEKASLVERWKMFT